MAGKRKRKSNIYKASDEAWVKWCKTLNVDAERQQSTLSYVTYLVGWNAAMSHELARLKAARKGAK